MAKNKQVQNEEQEQEETKKGKGSNKVIIIILALLVLGAGSFGGVYLFLSNNSSPKEKIIVETKVELLKELTINLDSGGYLKTSLFISFDEENSDLAEEITAKTIEIQDKMIRALPGLKDCEVLMFNHLINEEIPEGLEQITLKAMQKDTSKRYQSAAEMLSDIDEFKRNPSIKFEYTYFGDEPTRYVDAITRIRGNDDEEDAPSYKKEKKAKGKLSAMAILGVVAAALVVVAAVFVVVFSLSSRTARPEITVDTFIGMSYTDEHTWDDVCFNDEDLLQTVFFDGKLVKEYTLDEVRKNLYPEV